MNPTCAQCGGACCWGVMIDPFRGFSGDEQRWLKLHGFKKPDRIKLDKACEMLNDGKCSIYETRPNVCKRFVVGSPECLFAQKVFVKTLSDEGKPSQPGRVQQ